MAASRMRHTLPSLAVAAVRSPAVGRPVIAAGESDFVRASTERDHQSCGKRVDDVHQLDASDENRSYDFNITYPVTRLGLGTGVPFWTTIAVGNSPSAI